MEPTSVAGTDRLDRRHRTFASDRAGVVGPRFTGLMPTIFHGSVLIPLPTAGGLCILGADAYLFVIGPIEPLPLPPAPGGAMRCPEP